MLVTGIDINYEIIKIVVVKVDNNYKFKQIEICKEVSLMPGNILHTYIAIIQPYCKDTVVIGSSTTRFKTIYLNFSKLKDVNYTIYSLSNIIFTRNRCLFGYYINQKKPFFLKGYLNNYIKSQSYINIVFQKDFNFYFKFFHILKTYKIYIVSKEIALFYIPKLINNKSINKALFNKHPIGIVCLSLHEVNICIIKKNEIVNHYSLYYSYALNYIDIIQKLHQLTICQFPTKIIAMGSKKYSYLLQKHIFILLKQDIYYIETLKLSIQGNLANFSFPIVYIYAFLNKKFNTGIVRIQNPIKVLDINKQEKKLLVLEKTYIIIFIGMLLLLDALNYTSYVNTMNFINSICFIEIIQLTERT